MKIETSTKIHEISWSDENTKWEETFAARVGEPLIEFLVRSGEIMLLAGAFQVAANAVNNAALDVVAGVMFFALAMHFGVTWSRYVLFPLRGVRVRKSRRNLVLIIVIGFVLGGLQLFLWQQISEAAKAIALPA